ncbi:DUF6745 domain-containing protein [Actinomadura hibisca]|uniref:DUF6745 domain-containing protein n=1 Tax=Actinomadura hibisca TaxID=68565 RepID=UPI00082CD7AD|nr:hypothetical protein [Actinomadura hibisca]
MSARETSRRAEPRDVPKILALGRQALEIRAEWLRHALSVERADRPAAEAAIAGLYRLAGQPPPRFVWVDSPGAALAAAPTDRPFSLSSDDLPDVWPVASLLASMVSTFRADLDQRVGRDWAVPSWDRREPRLMDVETALLEGTPLRDVVDHAVRDPLRLFVRDQVCTPLTMMLREQAGASPGLAWHGQHDAYWIAHYDAQQRLGLAHYSSEQRHQLGLWAALARSCGWWWPYDEVCVVSERPVAVHTEPMPGRTQGEHWLHHPDGPAVRYADGWSLHSWHGTRVPEWVITDPTAERIGGEPNVEVRRCAVERIGWDAYLGQAGMRLVSSAPDPGNPGFELHLYDVPHQAWGGSARVLLAVNGSVERDGERRRYGLNVPGHLDDPVAAAAWSYGLSGPQYAQLARRT